MGVRSVSLANGPAFVDPYNHATITTNSDLCGEAACRGHCWAVTDGLRSGTLLKAKAAIAHETVTAVVKLIVLSALATVGDMTINPPGQLGDLLRLRHRKRRFTQAWSSARQRWWRLRRLCARGCGGGCKVGFGFGGCGGCGCAGCGLGWWGVYGIGCAVGTGVACCIYWGGCRYC